MARTVNNAYDKQDKNGIGRIIAAGEPLQNSRVDAYCGLKKDAPTILRIGKGFTIKVQPLG